MDWLVLYLQNSTTLGTCYCIIFILWKQFNAVEHVMVQDQYDQILKHYD